MTRNDSVWPVNRAHWNATQRQLPVFGADKMILIALDMLLL